MSREIEGTIAGRLYESGRDYLGITEVTLPKLEFETFEMKGLGLCGSANYSALSQFKPMTVTFTFRDICTGLHVLADQRMHNLTLCVAKQDFDKQAVEIPVSDSKYEFRCEPISTDYGKVAPASQQNPTVEMAVFMIKHTIDDVIKLHIDVTNYIYVGNDGVDRAAPIRRALNMAY